GRCACRCGGTVLPWNTFQVLTSTALTVGEREGRDRRPARLHAVVRPRARGGARAAGPRRRARHFTVPVRGAPAPRGLPAERALLPALLARVRPLARPVAAEGRRASRRRRLACAAPSGRAPRPVAPPPPPPR